MIFTPLFFVAKPYTWSLLILSIALLALEIVPVPVTPIPEEELVRDEKDRPILRAAVAEQVDVLLTGDKDLLESGITDPKILRADKFLERAL